MTKRHAYESRRATNLSRQFAEDLSLSPGNLLAIAVASMLLVVLALTMVFSFNEDALVEPSPSGVEIGQSAFE